jgi:hypothetical protein
MPARAAHAQQIDAPQRRLVELERRAEDFVDELAADFRGARPFGEIQHLQRPVDRRREQLHRLVARANGDAKCIVAAHDCLHGLFERPHVQVAVDLVCHAEVELHAVRIEDLTQPHAPLCGRQRECRVLAVHLFAHSLASQNASVVARDARRGSTDRQQLDRSARYAAAATALAKRLTIASTSCSLTMSGGRNRSTAP